MRRDGATYKEIGAVFGVSHQRISQILKNQIRTRKCSTDMEKIPYEGLYNYLMDNPKMTFPALAMAMFGAGDAKTSHKMRNLLHGKNCMVSKRSYDKLMALTGMTYEQLFKLREGFKEEDDG
jgi:hypothetical protein